MKILFLFFLFTAFFIGFAGNLVARQTEQERLAEERHKRQQEEYWRKVNERTRQKQDPPREEDLYAAQRKNAAHTANRALVWSVKRELTPEEKARITPAREDFEKYAAFLKRSGTGLARILPDPNCGSDQVINLSKPQCAGALPIPGRGAFYSFRLKINYTFPYGDLHFIDGKFSVGGKTELGIISKIGDAALENLTDKSPEVLPIRALKAAKTTAEIGEQEEKVKNGFSAGGFNYSNKTTAELNQTYVLRTIAFRHEEQFFNDKRSDIVVVFRVVRQDASDGAITILWRKLDEDYAPLITK